MAFPAHFYAQFVLAGHFDCATKTTFRKFDYFQVTSPLVFSFQDYDLMPVVLLLLTHQTSVQNTICLISPNFPQIRVSSPGQWTNWGSSPKRRRGKSMLSFNFWFLHTPSDSWGLGEGSLEREQYCFDLYNYIYLFVFLHFCPFIHLYVWVLKSDTGRWSNARFTFFSCRY